ncbi:MAG: CidA/LrgA family protein [Bacteroidales bacterium]
MIRQCAIIFGCLALGHLLVTITGLSLPASIMGMILLTLLLHFKIVKPEWVKDVAGFLTEHLPFFFIPPGVAVMLHLEIIKKELYPILSASLLSTLLVLAFTGWSFQWTRKIQRKIRSSIK